MKKVLVIDDSEEIREGTIEILRLAGYDAQGAKNGKEGVDLAQKIIPDVVLCDITMPELDGYGVLYLLQKNARTAQIPFIFMTAKADRAEVRKGMESGADDYLIKPFDEMELFKAIDSRLKKSKTPAVFQKTETSNNALNVLLEMGKTKSFSSKQVLFVEGEEPSHLYYVKKGQVRTYRRVADGRELAVGLYGEGDFFGYESLCAKTVYGDNASTLDAVELVVIAKKDFVNSIAQYPDIAHLFLNILAGKLQRRQDRMLRLAYFSVRKRVAEAIVELATKFGEREGEGYALKVSRDDLSTLVGAAGETLSRVLADFKDEKLIEKRGNTILISSIERLQNIKQ